MQMLLLFQEGQSLVATPAEAGVEQVIQSMVLWVRLGVEATGAFIITLGVVVSIYYFIRSLIPPQLESYNKIRLTLSRFLALALEFQLGADILSTAIAPSWDQIGKLGAIALIRTALNYFLTREMREERKGVGPDAAFGSEKVGAGAEKLACDADEQN